MNEEETGLYYAFRGRRIIAGPFTKRIEARGFKTVGLSCRFCGEYSGGNSVCRSCLVVIFDNQTRDKKKASAGSSVAPLLNSAHSSPSDAEPLVKEGVREGKRRTIKARYSIKIITNVHDFNDSCDQCHKLIKPGEIMVVFKKGHPESDPLHCCPACGIPDQESPLWRDFFMALESKSLR